jgi:hypothetical protein
MFLRTTSTLRPQWTAWHLTLRFLQEGSILSSVAFMASSNARAKNDSSNTALGFFVGPSMTVTAQPNIVLKCVCCILTAFSCFWGILLLLLSTNERKIDAAQCLGDRVFEKACSHELHLSVRFIFSTFAPETFAGSIMKGLQ